MLDNNHIQAHLTSDSNMSEADKKKGVNLCYVTSYICILAIGMV